MRQSRLREPIGWARLGFGALLVLGVTAAPALDIITANIPIIGRPERLLYVVFLVWALSLVAWWSLTMAGFPVIGARNATISASFLLMNGGWLLREFGTSLGWFFLLSAIGVFAVLFLLIDYPSLIADAVITGLVVLVISGPLISLYENPMVWERGEAAESGSKPRVELRAKPDIFVVVVDGYPGLRALRMDGVTVNSELMDHLASAGFQLPDSAWSAYPSTNKSIPSILNMSYPVTRHIEDRAMAERLNRMIGGENALVRTLDHNGYETTMIESGWSGSSCSEEYNNCVPAPILDEAMFWLLRKTAFGPHVLNQNGYSFTVGTRKTMRWLLENAPSISQSEAPELVFAHVLAPHPPFFLDESCGTVVSPERTGVKFYIPGVERSLREAYFEMQRRCVDQFVGQLADVIEADDIVVLVGDHGSDRRSQLQVEPEEWDEEALIERMNVFLAVRTGTPCEIPDPILTPNLLRVVLGCISRENVPLLPNRVWKRSMVEVDSDLLEALLN